MVASILPADEQKILDLVREVFAGYAVKIVQYRDAHLAKFALKGGGGASVNLSKIAADYRGGESLAHIKAEMQTWPR
jgi:hypothetical protein